jgi:hypothetical protein
MIEKRSSRCIYRSSALVLAFDLILAAAPAIAREAVQYLNGKSLYDLCISSSPAKREGCVGYLEGIVDAGDNELIGSTCVPPGVTGDQLRDTFVKLLREHATWDRHLPADMLARMAFASFCGDKDR